MSSPVHVSPISRSFASSPPPATVSIDASARSDTEIRVVEGVGAQDSATVSSTAVSGDASGLRHENKEIESKSEETVSQLEDLDVQSDDTSVNTVEVHHTPVPLDTELGVMGEDMQDALSTLDD